MRYRTSLALALLVAILLTAVPVAQQSPAPNNAQNFLILGVFTSKKEALDPRNQDGVAAYRNYFRDVVAISYSDLSEKSPPAVVALERATDLGEAWLNLQGVKTDRVVGELLPLRDRRIDTLIVHSWGTVAILEALNRGFIRQLPRRLVVVNPPELNPRGGMRWQALAQRYPQLPIDVYIAQADIFEATRLARQQAIDQVIAGSAVTNPTGAPAPSTTASTETMLANYTARTVTLRTYQAPGSSIDAHGIRAFLDFAAARGLYNIGRNPVAVPEPAPAPAGSTDFLVEIRNSSAHIAAADEFAEHVTSSIRQVTADEEVRLRANEQRVWRYFLSLLESACSGASLSRFAKGAVFSHAQLRALSREQPADLSECAGVLVDAILNAGQPVDVSWLSRESARYLVAERREQEQAARDARRRAAEEQRERRSAEVSSSDRGGSRSGSDSSSDRSGGGNSDGSARRDLRGVSLNPGYYDGSRR